MRTLTIKKYPTLFGLLLPFLVSIIAGSCGLPKTLYLYPPLSFSASGSNTVMLDHNPQNYDALEGANQSFKGYEIYYRIYDTENTASSDISLLSNRINTFYDSPDRVMSYATGTLKFVRMKNSTTSSQPLISVSTPANPSQFVLTLNQVGNWTITNTATDASFDVVRTILDSSRQSFSQKSNYLVQDPDYSGAADNPDPIYVVFFAVAYANDPEAIGQMVFSIPAVINTPIQF